MVPGYENLTNPLMPNFSGAPQQNMDMIGSVRQQDPAQDKSLNCFFD